MVAKYFKFGLLLLLLFWWFVDIGSFCVLVILLVSMLVICLVVLF